MIDVIGWIVVIYVIGCWVFGLGWFLFQPEEWKWANRPWIQIPQFVLMCPLLVIVQLVEMLSDWRSR